MNKEAKALSRREFLKSFPQQLFKGMRSITRSCLPIAILEEAGLSKEKTSLGPKKALLDITQCLAWEGLSCQLCYLACPLRDKAISIEDLKPIIHASFCDGCTLCLAACRTVNDMVAIRMVDAVEHTGNYK